MAEFNQLRHLKMRQRAVLFAITGEVPDVLLSRRFGHEHASLKASVRCGSAARSNERNRVANSLAPILRRFVDFRMARVNRGTELDFLVGSGTGNGSGAGFRSWPAKFLAAGTVAGSPAWGHFGDLSYNPGMNAALFGPDQGNGAPA
jgi:hypothetical protein